MCADYDGANHDNAEIFSPPYLFNANGSLATRPAILNPAPGSTTMATCNAALMVTTDSPVTAFSLIRVGCA